MENNTGRFELKNISLVDKIGYGFGNWGFGVIYQLVASYLVFYATAVLGVPGSFIGIAVSISAIWDAVTDPLMGYISDRTYSKMFGRRHIYLIIGSIGTAAANYALWIVDPSMTPLEMFLWILIDLLILKSFTTIYSTPYVALGGELSVDYNERTSIQGIKTIFFILGLFSAAVMGMFIFFRPTSDFPIGQLNPAAYKNMGIFSSCMALIFGLICFYSTKKYIPHLPKLNNDQNRKRGTITDLFASFGKALKNNNYKYVAVGYLFINIASSIASSLGMHVFTYTFKLNNNSIAFIIGAQFLVSILSQPVWVMISKKIDKKPSIIWGLIISIIGAAFFLSLVLMRDIVLGNMYYLLPFSILLGFGIGGLFSIPLSMIADTIDVEELKFGTRTEGVYYGGLTFFYKLSQSISLFILGVLLDVIKFDSSRPQQPEGTVIILGLVMAAGCILAFVFALFAYARYDLNREKIDNIQREISKRKSVTESL